jgi:hypothetical protein
MGNTIEKAEDKPTLDRENLTGKYGLVFPMASFRRLGQNAGLKSPIEIPLSFRTDDVVDLSHIDFSDPLMKDVVALILWATGQAVVSSKAENQRLTDSNAHLKAQNGKLEAKVGTLTTEVRQLRVEATQAARAAANNTEVTELRRQLAETQTKLTRANTTIAGQQETIAGLKQEKAAQGLENNRLRGAVRRLARGAGQLAEVAEAAIWTGQAPHVQRSANRPDVETFPPLVELPEWVADKLAGKLVLHDSTIPVVRKCQHPHPATIFNALALLAGEYRDMRLKPGPDNLTRFEAKKTALRLSNRPSLHESTWGSRTYRDEYKRMQNGTVYRLDWHLKRNGLRVYYASTLMPETQAVFVGHAPTHLSNRWD